MDVKRSISVMVIGALLGGGILPGCVFKTRDPVAPGSGGSTWVTPESSVQVFENLKSGLEELDGVNYNRSLNDAFAFVPLPDDVAQFPPGIFEDWTADVEKLVVQGIVSDATSISVTFVGLTQTIDQSDFAQFEGSYTLIVASAAGVDTFKGKGRFDILRGSKGWELVRWEDIVRESGFPTWGFLRGRTRQQQEG